MSHATELSDRAVRVALDAGARLASMAKKRKKVVHLTIKTLKDSSVGSRLAPKFLDS